jgi:hypothetical protein
MGVEKPINNPEDYEEHLRRRLHLYEVRICKGCGQVIPIYIRHREGLEGHKTYLHSSKKHSRRTHCSMECRGLHESSRRLGGAPLRAALDFHYPDFIQAWETNDLYGIPSPDAPLGGYAGKAKR